MYYFEKETIAAAFTNLIDKNIDNGFISLLFSFKNSDPSAECSTPMLRVPFDEQQFSRDINQLFSFQDCETDTPHRYSSFFILSRDYVELVSQVLLKKVKLELTAIATMCLQSEPFADIPSEDELIKLFINRFRINDELKSSWFQNIDKIPLAYSETVITNASRKSAVEATFPNLSGNKTIVMNGKWLDKAGGDFGSGTYAQPLIKTGRIKDFLFIPSGELQHHLGVERPNVTHSIKDANRNTLYFGPAGTGKSTLARNDAITFGISPSNLTEVTFHPEYTYTDFVGGLKPQSLLKAVEGVKIRKSLSALDIIYDGYEPLIEFKFEPGPFTLACISAAKDKDNPHAIIIDELNRGNVPEILGDIFQLLDRNGNKSKTNSELISFLVDVCECSFFESGFEIPPNLYVFGTINPADQNVFTLDTAFKRRWKRKYVPINYTEDACKAMHISICGMNRPVFPRQFFV